MKKKIQKLHNIDSLSAKVKVRYSIEPEKHDARNKEVKDYL